VTQCHILNFERAAALLRLSSFVRAPHSRIHLSPGSSVSHGVGLARVVFLLLAGGRAARVPAHGLRAQAWGARAACAGGHLGVPGRARAHVGARAHRRLGGCGRARLPERPGAGLRGVLTWQAPRKPRPRRSSSSLGARRVAHAAAAGRVGRPAHVRASQAAGGRTNESGQSRRGPQRGASGCGAGKAGRARERAPPSAPPLYEPDLAHRAV